jgi:limonene-1,2-epoxide hydrolase
MSIEQSAEQVVRDWFHRVWHLRQPEVIDQLFVPDGQARGLGAEPVVGPKEFRAFYDLVTGAIDDTRVDLEHIMTHGPEVMFLGRLVGTDRKSRSDVNVLVAGHARVEGGKIVDATNVVDFVTLMQQMGAVSDDVVVSALSR